MPAGLLDGINDGLWDKANNALTSNIFLRSIAFSISSRFSDSLLSRAIKCKEACHGRTWWHWHVQKYNPPSLSSSWFFFALLNWIFFHFLSMFNFILILFIFLFHFLLLLKTASPFLQLPLLSSPSFRFLSFSFFLLPLGDRSCLRSELPPARLGSKSNQRLAPLPNLGRQLSIRRQSSLSRTTIFDLPTRRQLRSYSFSLHLPLVIKAPSCAIAIFQKWGLVQLR